MKKRFFTLLLAVAASVGTMFAWDYEGVQIGDLYYNLDDINKTAEVTYGIFPEEWYEYEDYKYSGTIFIPSSVTWYETTYSVTSIGYMAFYNCDSLTSVTLPNSVTSIGERAFYGCSGLTSPVYNAHVFAFMPTSYSGAYTIPDGIESIAHYAFEGCSGLTSVMIGNGVTHIGDAAFSGCSGLTSVTIGNSVTSIGYQAFSGCSSLTKVNISDIAAWCNIAFSGSNPLYYAKHLYVNNIEVTNLIIPNSVTSIGNWAFYGCSGLTSVTIPSSVTHIGDAAFSGCSGLTSVEIPNNVVDIAPYTFYGCSGLTSVTIGNSVKSFGQGAFSDCSSLTSVTINSDHILEYYIEGHEVVGNEVSYRISEIFGTQVKEYIIGEAVTSIGEGTFRECTGFTSVTIGNNVTSIGDFAFYNCDSLASVTIGNSVTSIGTNAFTGCSSLTKVNISDIAAWCNIDFSYISSILLESNPLSYAKHLYVNDVEMTNLVIPNSVTSITSGAFFNCESLTTVYIPSSVTKIGAYAFDGCRNMTSVTIPNSVTSIGKSAFEDCSGLTSVTIPNSVTSIGDWAFENCSALEKLTIGTGIQNINVNILNGCNNLINLTIYAKTIPQLDYGMWIPDEYYVRITVYVLADMVQQYKTAAYWRNFANILPISGDAVNVTNTTVTTTATTADIAWPQVNGAASYELVIKDKNGNVVCTLIFDAEGHLTSLTFNAPARNNAPQQTQTAGFSFSIIGLDSGTTYNYTITAKGNNGNVLKTESGTFTTAGALQGIEDVQSEQAQGSKILRNGQIFILRGEKTYTVTGQEVK